MGTDGAAAKPTLTAQHCGATSHVCTDETRISDKQRRKIAEMAMRTGAAVPEDIDAMDSARAEQWLEARFAEWIALPAANLKTDDDQALPGPCDISAVTGLDTTVPAWVSTCWSQGRSP